MTAPTFAPTFEKRQLPTGFERFKPMLSGKVGDDLAGLRYPLLASPKIDGIRAVVLGGRLLTRSLKLVPNDFIRSVLEQPCFEGLDGELVAVDEQWCITDFQASTSAVMRRTGQPRVAFCVFDDVTAYGMPFAARLERVFSRLKDAPISSIPLKITDVPHRTIYAPDDLLEYEAHCLAEGYEGVMLRDPNGPYKYGRSTLREGWLLKLKRFEDAEAVVIDFEERMHNENEAYRDELGRTKRSSAKAGKVGTGTLGALVCRGAGGVQFNVGTGFDDAQRAALWAERDALPGRIVKFKHLPHGAKEAPRHPVFLGFRDARDM